MTYNRITNYGATKERIGRIKGELSASVLGFCLCGGLAGEGLKVQPGSIPAWLQFGVPVTQMLHLHVQKTPVLKCCTIPPTPFQRVWSTCL